MAQKYIDPQFIDLFDDKNLFEQIEQFDGVVFRSLENRRTTRIEKADQRFFVKCHLGVGWREIFKTSVNYDGLWLVLRMNLKH